MPRSRGRRRRLLVRAAGAGSALAVALGAGASPAVAAGHSHTANARTTLTLPAPSGRYQVGQVNLHLVDRSRSDPFVAGSTYRELMVTLWYPATSTSGHAAAPWLQSVAAAHFLANWGVSPNQVALPTTAGHLGAPVNTAAGKLPVLLYSTGLHSDRSMGTALAEDLASRGYLVVTVDHTHDASEVQFPGNRLVTDAAYPSGFHSSVTETIRAQDVRFVINQLALIAKGTNPDVDHAALPTGLAKNINMSEIGMYGWSLGGSTVPVAMHLDSRIKAGANLDGTYYGPVSTENLSRPFLLFSSQYHNRNTDSSWAKFWSHLTGYRLDLKLNGSRHLSFSDNEALLTQAATYLGLTSTDLKNDLGTLTPARAIAIQRTYLAAFFDQELRGKKSTLLNGPTSSYPEIAFVR